MALRLIRQNSDTPNVTNVDDARMVRYAYGGYDGYVKNRGTECGHEVNGNIFRITSGVLSLQGWESEIDSTGWEMTVDTVTSKRYFSVYYEVNGSTGTAQIKSVYDSAGYPPIDAGDDLTRTTNGIARMLLYNFTATNSVISDVAKKVKVIEYAVSKFQNIEERLDKLGFKSARIYNTSFGSDGKTLVKGEQVGEISRQGNYVIINFNRTFAALAPVVIMPDEGFPLSDFVPAGTDLFTPTTDWLGNTVYPTYTLSKQKVTYYPSQDVVNSVYLQFSKELNGCLTIKNRIDEGSATATGVARGCYGYEADPL